MFTFIIFGCDRVYTILNKCDIMYASHTTCHPIYVDFVNEVDINHYILTTRQR